MAEGRHQILPIHAPIIHPLTPAIAAMTLVQRHFELVVFAP